MKFIFVLILISLLLVSACHKNDEKNEEKCKYNLSIFSMDTSLFISFEIDGNLIKYYQGDNNFDDIGKLYGTFNYNEAKAMYSYYHSIYFGDKYGTNGNYYTFSPMITLDFYHYSILDKTETFQMPLLSKVLETSYTYTYPPGDPEIGDSIFMHGISIALSTYNSNEKDLYSTGNVMQYFGYNVDSLSYFYLGSSYFYITAALPVCENYFLIQGGFSTTLIYKYSPFKERELENGMFNFLLKR